MVADKAYMPDVAHSQVISVASNPCAQPSSLAILTGDDDNDRDDSEDEHNDDNEADDDDDDIAWW